jgi:tetratricopeptide (TPR) repeat protein
MGRLYLEVGRPERARDAFRKSLYGEPDGPYSGACLLGIGESYLREGSPAPAVLALRDAVGKPASGEDRDEAYWLLAKALEASGQHAEALEARGKVSDPSRARLEVLEREIAIPMPPRATPPPAVGAPRATAAILPRSRWGAEPLRHTAEPMGPPRAITVHHSARAQPVATYQDATEEIRRIQRAHQRDEGWADIGYHFLIDGSGRLYEGRPLSVQGAQAGNDSANRGNVGICLLGDFDRTAPTESQRETLEALVAALRSKYGIPASSIYTHREIRRRFGLGYTECPGARLQALVERMRASGRRAARASGSAASPISG